MPLRREKRIFTDEFKQQVVSLYNNGKSRSEIIKEYDLTASAFSKWINNIILVNHLKQWIIEPQKKMN